MQKGSVKGRCRGRVSAGLVAALLLAYPAGPAFAGAWTLPKGAGQVIVSGLYMEAGKAFDADGDRVALPRFSKGEVAVYGEYGIVDGFTAIVEGNASSVSAGAPLSFDEARFGLGALGGRLRFWEGGGSIVSGEITARLSPAETDAPRRLPVEAEADLRLLAGHGFSLGGMPAFADAALAYRFAVPLEAAERERGDEVRLDVTLGLRPHPDWLVLAQSFNAFERSEAARRSHKVELSLVHDLSKTLSLQLGLLASVAGAGVLDERGIVAAVWTRF